MTAYSVFYCDSNRCSIQPVRAMDAEHAIAKLVASQPIVLRLAAISNEGLEGVDIPQLLNDWIQARNCRQSTSPLHG